MARKLKRSKKRLQTWRTKLPAVEKGHVAGRSELHLDKAKMRKLRKARKG